jgi:hypothetical protein
VGDSSTQPTHLTAVTPAQAGIRSTGAVPREKMDSGLRRNDVASFLDAPHMNPRTLAQLRAARPRRKDKARSAGDVALRALA